MRVQLQCKYDLGTCVRSNDAWFREGLNGEGGDPMGKRGSNAADLRMVIAH